MSIQLKKECKYYLVVPTSMGVRITPVNGQPVHSSDTFKEMINTVKKAFPGVPVFATTLRQVVSANQHLWGGIMLEGKNWYVINPREINVLDRIGGVGGFVGGLLYGHLKTGLNNNENCSRQ